MVISAVEIFNPPVFPNIPGLDSFENPSFHTADWPEGLDVRGKRVAIIGNGASAMQVGPEIQPLGEIADGVSAFAALDHSVSAVPQESAGRHPYADARSAAVSSSGIARSAGRSATVSIRCCRRTPAGRTRTARSTQASEDMRQFLIKYIKDELGGRDDLLPKLVPTYPPWGKRMLRDNGWYRMLTKPNVTLVDTPIARIGADRLIWLMAAKSEADVLMIATGFDAIHFMTCFDAIGRERSRACGQMWDDDARAYKGLAAPGFPNFFTLYGPQHPARPRRKPDLCGRNADALHHGPAAKNAGAEHRHGGMPSGCARCL